MKSTQRVPVASRQISYAPVPETEFSGRVHEDPYDQADPEEGIEYFTVRDFLRMVPFKINMEQVKQFGRELGYSADALHLSYLPKIDPEYGPTRAFPMMLLIKVYKVMAVKLGWPKFVQADPSSIEDETKAREELAANKRAEKMLEGLSVRLDDIEALNAVETLRTCIRSESLRIRQVFEVPPSPPPVTAA